MIFLKKFASEFLEKHEKMLIHYFFWSLTHYYVVKYLNLLMISHACSTGNILLQAKELLENECSLVTVIKS